MGLRQMIGRKECVLFSIWRRVGSPSVGTIGLDKWFIMAQEDFPMSSLKLITLWSEL